MNRSIKRVCREICRTHFTLMWSCRLWDNAAACVLRSAAIYYGAKPAPTSCTHVCSNTRKALVMRTRAFSLCCCDFVCLFVWLMQSRRVKMQTFAWCVCACPSSEYHQNLFDDEVHQCPVSQVDASPFFVSSEYHQDWWQDLVGRHMVRVED